MTAPVPTDEAARLDSLFACGILDTPPEAAFERIVKLAADALHMPMVLVSFVERDRQWHKAKLGFSVHEIPRSSSFCAHAILSPEVMVVPDAAADARFADNPLVVGEPHLRFYAGVPLAAPGGQPLGALCVLDHRPREFGERERGILSGLAALVMDELSLRREIAARQRAEALLQAHCQSLQNFNDLIEQQVASRTVELTRVNEALHSEISRRNLADEARLRSEQRFRQLFNQAGDAAIVHDSDGRLLDVNDAACASLGYSRDELLTLGVPDLEMTHDPVEGPRFWRELEAGSVNQFEGCHRRKDGSTFPVEIHVSVLDTSEGRRLLALIRDITGRRHQEELLRAAKEEAERANHAKSVFLSRMSHELRTPLNAILGFGQLLELSPLAPQDATSLSYILKGGRHLLALIDEVLDLSRAETGDLHLTRQDVNVGALARECVGLVARLAQGREVTCRVEVPEGASLWTDEQRLRQVLLNLLSNAVKYNRPGGEVVVGSEEATPGTVRVKVRDTGPGISDAGMARLFVPFERLEQEYGEAEGTGLGLVISRRIAEAMGGALGVESVPGQGSTFWIELPLAAGPSITTTAPAVPPAAPTPPARKTVVPGATLLYIEDNLSNLQVVKALLANCRPRWRFLSAQDGREGLEQARQSLPDLVLLDLHLPGMKGDAVLAGLRQDPLTHAIPVVMLSADATQYSRERLLAGGASDYVSKPFKVDTLLELLDRTLLQVAANP